LIGTETETETETVRGKVKDSARVAAQLGVAAVYVIQDLRQGV
jgi:hypothetical protein